MFYNEDLWIFGFVIEDEKSISELLSLRQTFLSECGPYLEVRKLHQHYHFINK
jgi:hypothetical protein